MKAIYGMFIQIDQRFSNGIAKIDAVISQFDWYKFPRKVQQVLPTTMLSAQEPAVIKCFGNVQCSRIQFQKVSFILLYHKMLIQIVNECFYFRWWKPCIRISWCYVDFINSSECRQICGPLMHSHRKKGFHSKYHASYKKHQLPIVLYDETITATTASKDKQKRFFAVCVFSGYSPKSIIRSEPTALPHFH